MKKEPPFNPLSKKNLGVSVADALLIRDACALPPEPFVGAGIYAIYYMGNHPAYTRLVDANRAECETRPVYVGKAVPAGARKGGFGLDISPGQVLCRRLIEHARSIEQAANLDLGDFYCRYLVVEDIWIPLGESLLIERFSPVWNKVADGFGNHDPGKGRRNQQRSPWDVLHPGREWADKLPQASRSPESVMQDIQRFLAEPE